MSFKIESVRILAPDFYNANMVKTLAKSDVKGRAFKLKWDLEGSHAGDAVSAVASQ